jgi:hypothetical protein
VEIERAFCFCCNFCDAEELVGVILTCEKSERDAALGTECTENAGIVLSAKILEASLYFIFPLFSSFLPFIHTMNGWH